MKKTINSKKRIVVTIILLAVMTIVLVLTSDGKALSDWMKSVPVETADIESVTSSANTTEGAPASITPMGGSKLSKEIDDIRQEGDQMIEHADALIAKYRVDNGALPNSTTKQRIDDLKARLEQSDSE